MKTVDLHPEELLEREARGELTPAESDRLRGHLEACNVCRFERLARRDVGAEINRAEEVDVQRLLATVLTPEALRRPESPRKVIVRRIALRPRAMLLAAAMVCVASVAGAAVYTELRERVTGHPEDQVEPPSPSRIRAKAHGKRGDARDLVASGRSSEGIAAPAPELPNKLATLPPSAEPSGTSLEPPVVFDAHHASFHPSAPSRLGRARVATPLSAPEPPAGPAVLFDQANQARHAGDRAGAVQGYRTLLAQYPGSAEAHEALAALGKILLDGGDVARAVSCFDDYLAGGGALRQDVMADRALALQRLGRPGDEAAAWSALLASYPASVHGERARRRLVELEKR